MLSHPTALARALCDALGLNASVTRSITIVAEAGELPTVMVEQFVTDEDEALTTLLRTYEFHEREPTEEP